MAGITYYLNLTAAGICIVLIIIILVSRFFLQLPRFFYYLGLYLFLASLGSLTNAFLSDSGFSNWYRELYLLFHVFGICSIVPFFRMIAGVNPVFRLVFVRRGISILAAALVLLVCVDLLFDLKLIITDASPENFLIADSGRFILFPAESVISLVMSLSIFIAARKADRRDRKLFRMLFIMTFIQTVSVNWDFYQLLTNENPVEYNFYLYSFGLLLMYIILFIFFIEYAAMVGKGFRYAKPSPAVRAKRELNPIDSGHEDKRLYEKIRKRFLRR